MRVGVWFREYSKAKNVSDDKRGVAAAVHAKVGQLIRREALRVQRPETAFVAEERTSGHGLTDVELRYRQRYVDLITNEKSRQVFLTRARIVGELRRFFDARGYVEVETPMMHERADGEPKLHHLY